VQNEADSTRKAPQESHLAEALQFVRSNLFDARCRNLSSQVKVLRAPAFQRGIQAFLEHTILGRCATTLGTAVVNRA
jgi:hypothetical protein